MKSILISGPSGSGKSTLIDIAVENRFYSPKLYTSRPIGYGENEKTYYFRKELPCNLISWQNHGYEYGVDKNDFKNYEKIILPVSCFEIKNLREYFENSISIFIYTLLDVLEKRMKEKNRESTEEMNKRLEDAEEEIYFFCKKPNLFDYSIFNIETRYTLKDQFLEILNKENLI